MSYTNTLLEDAKRRLLDSTHDTTIDVFDPTESGQVDGVAVSYPGSPTVSDVPARFIDPSEDPQRDDSGTMADVDVVFEVRDDVGAAFDDFGVSGNAATRVTDRNTDIEYQVQSATDHKDGRLRLACVEV